MFEMGPGRSEFRWGRELKISYSGRGDMIPPACPIKSMLFFPLTYIKSPSFLYIVPVLFPNLRISQ